MKDYYSSFKNLRTQFMELVYAIVLDESLLAIQRVHEVSHECESVRSTLRSHDPSLSILVLLSYYVEKVFFNSSHYRKPEGLP